MLLNIFKFDVEVHLIHILSIGSQMRLVTKLNYFRTVGKINRIKFSTTRQTIDIKINKYILFNDVDNLFLRVERQFPC